MLLYNKLILKPKCLSQQILLTSLWPPSLTICNLQYNQYVGSSLNTHLYSKHFGIFHSFNMPVINFDCKLSIDPFYLMSQGDQNIIHQMILHKIKCVGFKPIQFKLT